MIVNVINSGLHQMFQNVTTVDISQSRMNLMTVVSYLCVDLYSISQAGGVNIL